MTDEAMERRGMQADGMRDEPWWSRPQRIRKLAAARKGSGITAGAAGPDGPSNLRDEVWLRELADFLEDREMILELRETELQLAKTTRLPVEALAAAAELGGRVSTIAARLDRMRLRRQHRSDVEYIESSIRTAVAAQVKVAEETTAAILDRLREMLAEHTGKPCDASSHPSHDLLTAVSEELRKAKAAADVSRETGKGAKGGTARVIQEITSLRALHGVRGFDDLHDDRHSGYELTQAAAAYLEAVVFGAAETATPFPWARRWDKRHKGVGPRELLIEAAALVVAEVEAIDRAIARGAYDPQPFREWAGSHKEGELLRIDACKARRRKGRGAMPRCERCEWLYARFRREGAGALGMEVKSHYEEPPRTVEVLVTVKDDGTCELEAGKGKPSASRAVAADGTVPPGWVPGPVELTPEETSRVRECAHRRSSPASILNKPQCQRCLDQARAAEDVGKVWHPVAPGHYRESPDTPRPDVPKDGRRVRECVERQLLAIPPNPLPRCARCEQLAWADAGYVVSVWIPTHYHEFATHTGPVGGVPTPETVAEIATENEGAKAEPAGALLVCSVKECGFAVSAGTAEAAVETMRAHEKGHAPERSDPVAISWFRKRPDGSTVPEPVPVLTGPLVGEEVVEAFAGTVRELSDAEAMAAGAAKVEAELAGESKDPAPERLPFGVYQLTRSAMAFRCWCGVTSGAVDSKLSAVAFKSSHVANTGHDPLGVELGVNGEWPVGMESGVVDPAYDRPVTVFRCSCGYFARSDEVAVVVASMCGHLARSGHAPSAKELGDAAPAQ